MTEKRLEAAVRTCYADPAQVAAFTEVADEGLSRFEQVLVTLAFAPGRRVLDIGCGGGREAIPMVQAGLRVVAMDLVPAMVRAAAARAGRQSLALPALVGDLTAPPFADETFDGVTLLGQVLAHVPGRAARVAALRAVRRVLRPGGTLALTTHNHRCTWKFRLYFACVNPWRWLVRRLGLGAGLGDFDRWSGRISTASARRPTFFHMYDLAEAIGDLRAAGFEIVEARGRAEFEAGRKDAVLGARDYLLGFIARRPGPDAARSFGRP